MRSALVGLADSLPSQERAEAVRRYLEHLDHSIEASPFDVEDRRMARQEDRQGIGLSRRSIDLPSLFGARVQMRSWSAQDLRRTTHWLTNPSIEHSVSYHAPEGVPL